ncbi:putative DNA-binding protein [Desmospora activa]|uniref:UPF0122 protein C8J48_1689 n=1 Tax=Desmospora activa DSM 45169 TaxID=1121389 RepID=A0A2T4ZB49_9BACL|nr:putative DNA-binding protein [Desmospora activa]PTM59087.1 hypothetical protein C8J48_1689 [Desmospora activa DSM 45169]
MLDKTTHINLLYDFYEPILTEKQRKVMELYYHEDWSLGEIADHLSISRQAVFETIKRSQSALEEWESMLQLAQKHQRRTQLLQAIRQMITDSSVEKEVTHLLDQMAELD